MSIIASQINLFDKDSRLWWSQNGPFSLLHAMNPLRVSYILKHVDDVAGLRILDIGCGGGILAESLARLGADVTAIDATQSAIDAAIAHAKLSSVFVNYQCSTVEDFETTLNEDVKFDLVIASEIIEHVADPKTFLTAALRCLKTNSLGLILSTLNRTSQSLLGAIVAAEYILRWVPKGTHEWKRFLKPSEIDILLKNIARENKEVCYSWSDLCGLKLNPFRKKWSYTRNMSNNYIGYITRI